MSRVQLAINVDDIDSAVEFYSVLFDTPPAKRRPGYANFAIAEPPLKLVLFEGAGASGTLNHVGVERESMDEVVAQADRLEAAGLTLDTESDVVCCYARQSKHWATGPDGQRWENYVVLEDAGAELEGKQDAEVASGSEKNGCCATATADSASDTQATTVSTGCCG